MFTDFFAPEPTDDELRDAAELLGLDENADAREAAELLDLAPDSKDDEVLPPMK